MDHVRPDRCPKCNNNLYMRKEFVAKEVIGDVDDQKLKRDIGKLRYDLIPRGAERALAKAVTFGMSKGYDEDSWKSVERKRYVAALKRHMEEYLDGSSFDKEAKDYGFDVHPLELVMINAAFLLWIEQIGSNT